MNLFAIFSLLIFTSSCYANLCDEITVLQQNGETQFEQANYANAIKWFDHGIENIGDRYLSDKLLDDTTTKLTLSKLVQQEGNLQQAAYLRMGVLSSRLSVLQQDSSQCQ